MKKELQSKFCTRQYMLAKDFEIYYYSDHYINKVNSHGHDYYEFYFFIEGQVSLQIEAEEYPLEYGDVVFIPPGVRHHAIIHDKNQPYRRFVLWISKKYFSQLIEESESYGYLLHDRQSQMNYVFHNETIVFNTIQTKIFHLIEELRSNRFGKAAKVSLCMKDLLLHLNRIVYEQLHFGGSQQELSLCDKLTDYIAEHLEDDLSLTTLAAEFYVSKYHIAHIFKANMGLGMHQYITKKRVSACRDAIVHNTKISQVYLTYGFKDYSGFYRAFRKEYGMSPKEYQELNMFP